MLKGVGWDRVCSRSLVFDLLAYRIEQWWDSPFHTFHWFKLEKVIPPYIWILACWLQVNNDRSRDYTIPNTPMVNSQPSILGQQPVSVMGPTVQYNGAPYTPTPEQQPGMPQTSAGWGPVAPPMPQSMPMQMHSNPYMPPGTMPPQGMMQSSIQSGLPQSSMLPPYGSGQMQ